MYAIFKEEALALAQTVYADHVRFEQGEWGEADLHAHRQRQLRKILQYVCEHSAFYRDHLGKPSQAAVSQAEDIDITQLPFTTKEDLRAHGWDMVSAPLSDAWVYYETTGTTGKATPCPRSEIDSIHNNTPLILHYERILKQHGDQHVVGIMWPTEVHSTGDTFEDVMRSIGSPVVKMWPRSPVMGYSRAAELIEDLQITTLVCTPAVAIGLAKHFLAQGRDPKDTCVQVLMTLGELSTPQLLRNIGAAWGGHVYNCMYASQEASIMAVAQSDNKLYTVPLNNLYELIDPDTGAVMDVPLDHRDHVGELVVTHLYQGQKPLIRYRTGDMLRVRRQPDQTWQVTPVGRVRDRLMLNDCPVSAYDIEAALLEHLPGCLDYHIVIEAQHGRDGIAVVVANHAPAQLRFNTDLAANHMAEVLGVPVRISEGDTEGITATSAMVSWKAARIHDRRAPDDHERTVALAISANRGD